MFSMIGKDIDEAAALLRSGKLVAIPTETVYGLAANALDEHAVQKIYAAKKRPADNPLILHLAHRDMIRDYAAYIPDAAQQLIDRFCPGPLTLVLPKKKNIPGIVSAGRDTVAIRVPSHPVTRALLEKAALPLAAPSANPSGYISPTRPEHVAQMLGDAVAYILDGGSCDSGIESTIVGFEQGVPVIYRKGVITEQEIRAVAGATHRHSGNAIHAPGMSASHYSPDTMLVLTENLEAALAQYSHMYTGVLTYNQYTGTIPENRQIKLCDNDDWKTAARNLYAAMHRMDRDGYDIIIARRFPEYGIAAAINDRLQRASAKK